METRRVVRALLVDPDGAVLLMQITEPSSRRQVWITPGGGLDRTESAGDALRRELREEIGYDLAAERIGAHVWTRRHVFTWNGREYDQTEEFFLIRTERFTPDHCADGEPGDMQDYPHRWWTADEIASSTDDFGPRRLATTLASLLEHGVPAEPYDVGV